MPLTADNMIPVSSPADLEMRAARIADPNLKTKHTVACEIREMLDTIRDTESAPVLPQMIPALLDLLRSEKVSFQKDTVEYQFRRVLLEILHRIPYNVEGVRTQAVPLFSCMLHVLRHDNEENGVTACKAIVDLVRHYRPLTEELLAEFMAIFNTSFRSMKGLVDEVLSEDSPLLDPNVVLPSTRSFKVLAEMGMVMVIFSQSHRPLVAPTIQTTLPPAFEVLNIESPAQRRAREEFEAMGGYWAGMAPTIKNAHAYNDFINAEIKMVSYFAYIMRWTGDQDVMYGETLILTALRILQDCPANGIILRKDLMVVFRHLMATPHRTALLSQLDKLFDERVLLGTGVGSKEMLRANVYSAVADLVHHLRNDLTAAQLARIIHVYSRLIHSPSLNSNLHTLFAKMMFNLVDVVLAKETPQAAGRILGAMFESCVDRLEALNIVQQEVAASIERNKEGNENVLDAAFIERARPIGSAVYAIEKPEDVILESRLFFRTLLHGFRACLAGLRKCGGEGRPADLDGTLIFRLFEGCIRCMSYYDPDPRVSDTGDVIEWFVPVMLEVNLHVFQEVWTHKIDFFFQCAQKRIVLLNICQLLFTREACSPTLLAIVLKFLVDRLPLLGEHDDLTTAATIRLFKMVFGAVGSHPTTNEPILASYLAKLLMDCFPLSVKATRPTNYLHLLRALFRSIGGGGGRFELLYKEVLPLLPEMLENLNRQLLASEGQTRDMIVELCLTVPLRLTHLLPHLTYLMQPLALALRGSPELVSQGLRTLELCIDNLTPDFLDPTLSLVLRELMEALHSHLKPLPANHHHAHTTIRILGKLGGRNRRLLTRQPELKYHHHSEPARMSISFGGTPTRIELNPLSLLAARTIRNTSSPDRIHAYNYLENCLIIMLSEGLKGRNEEETFVHSLEGIFDAIYLPEVGEQALAFVHKLSRTVFDMEIRRSQSREPGSRPSPSPLLSSYLDSLPHALAREQAEHTKKAQDLVASIIQDLVTMGSNNNVTPQDIVPTLHQIASRFSSLCLDDSWVRKSAGCSGIKIMTCTPDLGVKWITDREVDLVRTLLHILKDLPLDLPRDIGDVVDVLTRVLRVSNTDLETQSDATAAQHKFIHLAGIFFPELQSSNPVVRQAAQTCIALLVELSGKPVVELLMPHRERMLAGIYTKPVRALPFPIQIGMLEAIRYCVSLDPPLVELNDELLRLLHETLALADADDGSLLGRGSLRQGSIEVVRLRVACIKLLTASMPLTDFFSRQHQTRQRVTSVYFKSLYSVSPEVKEVAYEGLRMVLTHQSRLPRELLQTGLRPILMNLADPKRLSVPGLEGLARLLELLTNYFKVEIGHKLLDHFRIVADPQMLQASSRLPLSDNEGITKLVRLANIFHLLPSTANMFLKNLVNAIVQTEAAMHFSSRSPFSEPLAKYLDRYPAEGADFFLQHLNYPRYLRTLRSIIQAKLAPNLQRELSSRTSIIVSHYLKGSDSHFVIPSLLLFSDLIDLGPAWTAENPYVIDALVDIWRSEQSQPEQLAVMVPEAIQRHSIILSVFTKALEQSPRIDLLFDIVSIFSRNLAMDHVRTSHFLYKHVALSTDLIYRRNVLMRFLTWFEDNSYSWSDKSFFIRYVVTPTLLVHAARSSAKGELIDRDFAAKIHRIIWRPVTESVGFADTDDMFKIELLHFTTIMVHHYPEFLEDVKKDIIKCAWHYITTSEDTIVKQTAYLLTAHFFAAFPTPQKFIIRAWTGLLRPPHSEGRALIRQEALATLAPSLPGSDPAEPGYPQWAKTTRRLLAEEGISQLIIIYQLIVKQPDLFYPVRALFVPHMVNSLSKLGLNVASTSESRLLSIDILQVIFDWEKKATESAETAPKSPAIWLTPVGFRENMVSYLVRLATVQHDAQARNNLVPRALSLLQVMVGPNGWSDVTVGLRFFLKALDGSELNSEPHVTQALAAAKVIQVIASDQNDAWYTANAPILQRLVRKGMITDEYLLHDALFPVFGRLLRLFPLPKEDEEPQQGDIAEFHGFVYSAIGDGLRNTTALRGTLLMLKAVVQVVPERVETFSSSLMKLLSKLAKEHIQATPSAQGYEGSVRLLITILEISEIAVAFLGDQRRWLLSALVVLVDKSKSSQLCRYTLDLARNWALHRHDPYPTMKEKASLLQKMMAFEIRGDALFQPYLELIYDIYTEPSLRRSDLTLRLEQSFLLGCRAQDPALRERFMTLYDLSIPRSLSARLTYILGVQSWEVLGDRNWIFLALHLLLGSVDADAPMVTERRSPFLPQTTSLFSKQKTQTIIRPMQRLLFLDVQAAHDTWVSVFPAAWSCLSRREQADITLHMIGLLSRDYHVKQAELRPNIIITLLTGIYACSPPMTLPPHLVKYLAKTYGAWHVGLEILGTAYNHVRDDDISVRDYVFDSLADVYAELAEEDMFYGLWRRRCLHLETNIAIAFEQNGMWEQASNAYETAQSKSRAGSIPFYEPEYCLWEDHWMLAAEKLQQWDTLYDLARSEGNQELMLESAWRIKDWAESRDSLEEQINQLPEVPTPRRRVFEAFIALLKLPGASDKNTEFTKILEDAMQLSLRKWVSLPPHLSAAHVPLLQHFQQFVELQEAVLIFGSLSATTAQNLEKKSQELKMVLQAWRERLPNLHDDISIWSDLVAWRQNVFSAINKAYIPLISGTTQNSGNTTATTNTYGYRGYHETAWIINRFAHVARKHDLLDACFTSLNKIYTLPNIEISEAFLKLREQARCHYQKPNDLQAGLEVINNTNLMYFSTSQKAEFYTLKGMFHARFGRNEEASQAFGQAVQLDMTQAKAWAEWGRFNDRMFKELPGDMSYAANAVSCYLQAAGQYKSGKSRPLLTRILWLLSVDDGTFTISRAFDTYKGDAAFWFWITLIPQLCLSISHREVKQARYILLNLAKLYPQALFFQLRTTREEMAQMKKASALRAAAQSAAASAGDVSRRVDQPMRDGTGDASHDKKEGAKVDTTGAQAPSVVPPEAAVTGINAHPPDSSSGRQPWEYIEEVVQILKTAFPLLILSMETMVDQIHTKFKPNPEEDIYRHICLLLQDAMQGFVLRMNAPEDDGQLASHTVSTLGRLAGGMGGQIRKDFEDDFLRSKPTHNDYIQRLQRWRDKYEKLLDTRPRMQPLDVLSHYLMEFQYSKVDEIEVPGQYTEDKDSNQNFIRIQKFAPKFENCRSHGSTWKRFTLHGSDNSRTSFSVQLPSQRHTRREERVMQLLRTFNGAINRKKEGRKRNLNFHLPAAISCSPTLRLFQTDSSYVTLADIYDRYCEESDIAREDPILVAGEKVKKVLREFRQQFQKQPNKTEYLTLKKEIFDEVVAKLVPEDILTRYMIRTMDGPSELWRMRKQFALHLASCSFMTFVFCLSSRQPHRFHISRTTGQIAMTELLPAVSSQAPVFATSDVVPFRFTPNMQNFIGTILTEGVLASGIMAIGRCLTEPEFDLEQQLCLFARDEVIAWMYGRGKPWAIDMAFRQNVDINIDGLVKRAETMACKNEREQALQNGANPGSVPVVHTVTNLISSATNPIQLTKMGEIYHPWF